MRIYQKISRECAAGLKERLMPQKETEGENN